jgi:hypothetical protein
MSLRPGRCDASRVEQSRRVEFTVVKFGSADSRMAVFNLPRCSEFSVVTNALQEDSNAAVFKPSIPGSSG